METKASQAVWNVVDLFSGCGGLSLGFDALQEPSGHKPFRSVLAMDNWKPAVEVFRSNHPAPRGSRLPIARLADLAWFNHWSEALLFYLVHFSEAHRDGQLRASLRQLGFDEYVSKLRALDEAFQAKLDHIGESTEHASAIAQVDAKVFSLALGKSILGKLHLASLREVRLDGTSLPWTTEQLLVEKSGVKPSMVSPDPVHRKAATDEWQEAIDRTKAAAEAVGRGQHKPNAVRMASLHGYLSSSAGTSVRKAWIEWFAGRLTLRSEFCLENAKKLRELYSGNRRVSVLLGGPPCKGFSRIGRAVIRELRDQGAHAWASNKFGDERNALMYRYVVFLEALRPKVFLFENVSNFASKLATPDGELNAPELLEELIDSLECEDLHYEVDAKIVRAKSHAVPQARERYIMCGISSEVSDGDPRAVLAIPSFSEHVTLGSALSGLPVAKMFRDQGNDTSTVSSVADPIGEGAEVATATYLRWVRQPSLISGAMSREVDAHIYRNPREDDARLYKLVAPGVRWMDLKVPQAESLSRVSALVADMAKALGVGAKNDALRDRAAEVAKRLNDSFALRLLLEQMSSGLHEKHHLLGEGYLSNGSGQHGDWLERLSASRPCKTVVAHIGKDTYGYIHPFEPRPITIREAARVQAFPDWFSFAGVGVVDAYSMIGNAVPPLLANHFAHRVAAALRKPAATSKVVPMRRASRSSEQQLLPFSTERHAASD
ncbi:MAG TPA: DNA cytosine methyltransferase [Luteibacter sp.]|uniref:DNA cytosine methyltransferase n=1 Tax=Luteibacter sp. TaxID=1886636 RepID=UPI002CA273AC|nr:DNA cytosine methyltransferase [Luteibacter sp.]HVI55872.1 DNA cytosine methyltransferase [Luteibacter sp.]